MPKQSTPNVAQFLTRSAKKFHSKSAIIQGEKQLSFFEENSRVNRLAYSLRLLGIRAGDRVAILQHNCRQLIESLFAIFKNGCAAVPINYRSHPKEVSYYLNNSEAKALLFGQEYCEAINSIRPELTALEHFICLENHPDVIYYEELVFKGKDVELVYDVEEDALAWLFYTSGTTGNPKGAMITYRNLHAMTTSALADVMQLSENDVALHVAPLTHGSGLYMFPVVAKGGLNIIPTWRGFNAQNFYESVQTYRVTTIPLMVPTQLKVLLDSYVDPKRFNLASLKWVVYGGAPAYVEDLKRAIKTFGKIFVQIYGQGESPMTITSLSADEHVIDGSERDLARLASAGTARSCVEVKVVGEDCHDLPPCSFGEIIVRGDTVIKGYWKNPEATAQTIKDGWLYTGDIGYFDEAGYLFIVDRSKDMIISGGANIYPREIEEIIVRHPAVHEACVIGVPDAVFGESVKAIVVLRQNAHATEQGIIDLCKANLASYKKPKSIDFVKELPKNAYGKVLKRELRQKYWENRQRKI